MNSRSPAGPRARWLLALLVLTALATTALVLVVLAAGGQDMERSATGFSGRQGPFLGNRLPDGVRNRRAPRVRLVDARGGVIDTRRLRGTPYVVTFLYTDCPDVCPLIAQELRQALLSLGRRARRVAVLAVSVDPRGDTREHVSAWLERRRMPRNFHYLIGTEAALRSVWRSYFVGPQRRDVKQSLHTASIWLVDAQGRWRTKFSGGVPVPSREIAHDLRVLLGERG